MKKEIDFRKNETQEFEGFGEKEIIKYVGKCPITGIRLYKSSGSNDPRGVLGWHAVTEFVAEEYDYTGKTILCSWIACNNDRNIYEKALAYAKKQWTKKEN